MCLVIPPLKNRSHPECSLAITKDGGPWVVWSSCIFYHDPLRSYFLYPVNYKANIHLSAPNCFNTPFQKFPPPFCVNMKSRLKLYRRTTKWPDEDVSTKNNRPLWVNLVKENNVRHLAAIHEPTNLVTASERIQTSSFLRFPKTQRNEKLGATT